MKEIFDEAKNADLYSISFDLDNKDKDSYNKIAKEIKGDGKSRKAMKATETQWIVRWENTSAEDIREHLLSHRVNGKKLFVKGDRLNVIDIADYSGFKLPSKF